MRRRFIKSGVKSHSLTMAGHWKLVNLSTVGASGTPSGAVECVDIWKNTGGEGGMLDGN